jgi:DEAD/DEAH box helicase domain-containing protein
MPRAPRSFPSQPRITPGGERPDVERDIHRVLAELLVHPGMKECFTHRHDIPAREAVFGEWPTNFPEGLRRALQSRGIERPYSHQAEAFSHALAGRNVVVITPTASGKSLCYNAPVVQSILNDSNARALYLFPTKALSHDQYGELHELTQAAGGNIKLFTYDGDTPPATRRALRDSGNIVVTNPDMLHGGILPHHTQWVRLFENLQYVVIDELHQYRGVFGSHMAGVLSRLRRICAFYGRKPVFLCSSATIANPKELAETLLGESVELVDRNGAPTGPKTFLFYNPPVINQELNVRRSVRLEARRIAMRFLANEHQAIVFGRSRIDVEVMTTYLKRGMARANRDPERVTGYRGGYLPTERRAIEQGLRNRDLLGVVSTNALELGVDIGSLEVSILAGYPGTIASVWQQAGRAGRRAGASVAIYIAGSSALDQFLMNHPDYFFGASPERAHINPSNLSIYAAHLKCAAFEVPFEDGETFSSVEPGPVLQYLEDEKVVRHSGNRWHYASDVYPAEDVSLRSAAGENFIVLDTGRNNLAIAEVDYDSAPFLLHDDAVYIHNGKPYLVERLDWDRRTAFVRHKVVDYYTDAESSSNVQVLQVDEEEQIATPSPVSMKRFGEVSVETVVTKFKKVKFETQESIGYGPVQVPPLVVQTEAAWLTFHKPKRSPDKSLTDFGGSLKAIAALLRHAVPLHVLCDPRDFSVMAMLKSPFDQEPAIYLWDRYPGGIGIARRVFQLHDEILRAALRMVSDCPCQRGCPSCIGAQLEAEVDLKELTTALLSQMIDP